MSHEVINGDSPIFFDVTQRRVYLRDISDPQAQCFTSIDGFKTITRQVDNVPMTLGIVGEGYKVITMSEICVAVEKQLRETLCEQFNQVTVIDQMAYHGAMCIRQYVFPRIAEMVDDKSNIAFRVVIVNAYDGSSSLKLFSGAIDFFCMNGMIHGQHSLMIARHTAGLTVHKITKTIKNATDLFYLDVATLKKWSKTPVTNSEAVLCLNKLAGDSERKRAGLAERFMIESQTRGLNLWALYSTGTYYASRSDHGYMIRNTDKNSEAAIMLQREKEVLAWRGSKEFAELAARAPQDVVTKENTNA